MPAGTRRVRARADNISYRNLERWGREHHTPLPRSTLLDVLAGRRLPRKPLLRTFLAACGVNTAADGRWESAWNRLAEQQPATVHPTRPRAGDTAPDALVAAARAQAEQIIADALAVRAAAQREIEQLRATVDREGRRREHLHEQLATDTVAAGLLRIGANYLNELEWDALFADVRELDIFVAYGQTWRNLHARRLHQLAQRAGARIRVFLPDPADAATVAVLADRFSITPAELTRRIEATRDEYLAIRHPDGAAIEIYYRSGDRVFSFYRLDRIAVVGFYSHRRNRLSAIPVFVCAAPGSLYEFVIDELQEIAL
ncbi:hypothetical protein ACQEVC_43160 [Plantactinospora sp. CA-294935]|uniref:hypothetical protein n=1 Tax=Plantactinospora sp. CA-294935 TaxID=3240012 RepID=UPI003D90CAE8